MKWTDEKPTEPGWYWWRQSGCDCHAESIVQIDVMFGAWIINCSDGASKAYRDMEGQWAGPLTPPEEP